MATFNKYDKQGHVLEQQRAQDVKEVYFWGYKWRYPVAKIVGNKTFDEIILLAGVDTALLNNGTATQIKNELARIGGILRPEPKLLVNTYTYIPLTGMTSETDVNNRTVYYEYDVFGRLELIRDQDQNVLKRICYNYAGQAEPCKLFFNGARSQIFTRSNCGSGFTAGTYTYMVPQGRYGAFSQTEADAFADADIAVNGQHWADSLGTCTGASYSSPDVSGYYTPGSCSYGQIAVPVYIYMPAGSYTSVISAQDAYDQALAGAQYYASLYGCQTAWEFRATNNLSVGVTLVFLKQGTNEEYMFYINPDYATTQSIGFLPEGTYTVELYPDYYPNSYGYYFSGPPTYGSLTYDSGSITIQNVVIQASSSGNYFYIE